MSTSLRRMGCDCFIRIDEKSTPTVFGRPQLQKDGVICGWEGIRQMKPELDGKNFFGVININVDVIVISLSTLPKTRSKQLVREIIIGPEGIVLGTPQVSEEAKK